MTYLEVSDVSRFVSSPRELAPLTLVGRRRSILRRAAIRGAKKQVRCKTPFSSKATIGAAGETKALRQASATALEHQRMIARRLRYEIDPEKLAHFEAQGEMSLDLILRFGGLHR